jgi:hypothetical protein
MTNDEKKQKIEDIYDTARQKILELQKQQETIIQQYLRDLEQKKIEALRQDIIDSY